MSEEKKTEPFKINPAYKNMLFGILEQGTLDACSELKFDVSRFGRLKELLYVITPAKKEQHIKWTTKPFNPKIDIIPVEDEQLDGFLNMVGIDPKTMFDTAKSFFVKLDFKTNIVHWEKNNKDGTQQKDTL